MKEVVLNGFIGEKYGKNWKVSADTLSDVFQCIECNYPEFRKDLIEMAQSGAGFDIQCGNNFLGEEDLLYTLPNDAIIITPIPAGAKSGFAKVLAAVAIVTLVAATGGFGGAGFFGSTAVTSSASTAGGVTTVTATTTAGLSTAGQIAIAMSASLAMQGLAQMMAPKVQTEGAGEDKYLFNGPENTIPQNNVIPVLFGEMIVGGAVIASGTVSGLRNRPYSYVVSPGSNISDAGIDITFGSLDTFNGGEDNRSLWI
jgi:predicted phage tail protein